MATTTRKGGTLSQRRKVLIHKSNYKHQLYQLMMYSFDDLAGHSLPMQVRSRPDHNRLLLTTTWMVNFAQLSLPPFNSLSSSLFPGHERFSFQPSPPSPQPPPTPVARSHIQEVACCESVSSVGDGENASEKLVGEYARIVFLASRVGGVVVVDVVVVGS